MVLTYSFKYTSRYLDGLLNTANLSFKQKYSKYPGEHKLNEEHSVNIGFVPVNIKIHV